MKNYTIIISLSALILFEGCHKKTMTQIQNTPTITTPLSSLTKQLIIDPAADMSNSGDAFMIENLGIEGSTLIINVSFSGGCKDHVFDLYFNGMYAKSLPVQATLNLKHTGNGDACRELVSRELKFDISKMKAPGGNTIVVKLADKQVNYTIQ